MAKKLAYLLSTIALAVCSRFALAGTVPGPGIPLPEPGTITLLATGVAAIAVVSRWRK